MFGVCIAGRLPQTPSSQPDPTHLIFTLEKASSINHVTVFMDGTTPFPSGYAATVHFLLPGGQGDQWKLLGCLKNDKPSAIFRLRGGASVTTAAQGGGGGGGTSSTGLGFSSGADAGSGSSSASSSSDTTTALLGISIESEESVSAQMATLSGGGASGMDSSDSNAGALVKANTSTTTTSPSIDPQMALALAPKIGEFSTTEQRVSKCSWECTLLTLFLVLHPSK